MLNSLREIVVCARGLDEMQDTVRTVLQHSMNCTGYVQDKRWTHVHHTATARSTVQYCRSSSNGTQRTNAQLYYTAQRVHGAGRYTCISTLRVFDTPPPCADVQTSRNARATSHDQARIHIGTFP